MAKKKKAAKKAPKKTATKAPKRSAKAKSAKRAGASTRAASAKASRKAPAPSPAAAPSRNGARAAASEHVPGRTATAYRQPATFSGTGTSRPDPIRDSLSKLRERAVSPLRSRPAGAVTLE